MTNTLEDKCKHEFLKFMRIQENDDLAFGKCYHCHSTIVITEKYRHTHSGVYELKPLEINAKGCRE